MYTHIISCMQVMSSPGLSKSKQLHNFELPDSWQTAGRLRDRRRGAGPSSKPPETQEAPTPPPAVKKADKREEELEEQDLPQLPDFSLQLNQKEISEDVYAITGKLPSRNMKKNTKDVQKQIDLIFPGGGLEAITVDRYKVPKKTKKKAK